MFQYFRSAPCEFLEVSSDKVERTLEELYIFPFHQFTCRGSLVRPILKNGCQVLRVLSGSMSLMEA